MQVKVFRANRDKTVVVDVNAILPSSVEWVSEAFLGKSYLRFPNYVLKCRISYRLAMEVDIASGCHDFGYNEANIFLRASDNKAPEYIEGYKYLCKLAGAKPTKHHGLPPCTKKILEAIGDALCLRKDIREKLLEEGYEKETIRRAFQVLEKTGRVLTSEHAKNSPKSQVWLPQK